MNFSHAVGMIKAYVLFFLMFLSIPTFSQESVVEAPKENPLGGISIDFTPHLMRKNDVSYDLGFESTSKSISPNWGLGLSFYIKPEEFHGVRASAGVNFESGRSIPFTNKDGASESFDAVASSAYLAVGYQFWKFYAEMGLIQPFSMDRDWNNYKVTTVMGGKMNIGFELTKNIQIEYYYRFHSYRLEDKDTSIQPYEVRIFPTSSGVMFKIGS